MQYLCLWVMAGFIVTVASYEPAGEKERIAEAVEWVTKLSTSKIQVGENGVLLFLVEDKYHHSFRLLEKSRTAEVGRHLVPFVDVRFLFYNADSPRVALSRIEVSADRILKAIGKPAADELLNGVKEGRLRDSQLKGARMVCVDILGEQGLRSRVKELGLEKNEKIKLLLGGK